MEYNSIYDKKKKVMAISPLLTCCGHQHIHQFHPVYLPSIHKKKNISFLYNKGKKGFITNRNVNLNLMFSKAEIHRVDQGAYVQLRKIT